MFDHGRYFREKNPPYRTVAIVGQPYNTSLEEAQKFAEKVGLAVTAPAEITQSWHFPGFTRFFCFTRPGVSVRLLQSHYKAELAEAASF